MLSRGRLARGGIVLRPRWQPSHFLLLHWELCWLGRSCVQQHKATECHGKADPPQRRPCLCEEKLAQDGLKERTETKLCWAEPPQSLLRCQSCEDFFCWENQPWKKTCSRKLLLGPPIEMAVPPGAGDDLLYHPAWKHSHTAVLKQDFDRCACALLPSQHLSGAKSPVNWVIPVNKKRASVT